MAYLFIGRKVLLKIKLLAKIAASSCNIGYLH